MSPAYPAAAVRLLIMPVALSAEQQEAVQEAAAAVMAALPQGTSRRTVLWCSRSRGLFCVVVLGSAHMSTYMPPLRPNESCTMATGDDFAALTSQPQHWHVTLFHTARLGDARPDAFAPDGGVNGSLKCPSVRIVCTTLQSHVHTTWIPRPSLGTHTCCMCSSGACMTLIRWLMPPGEDNLWHWLLMVNPPDTQEQLPPSEEQLAREVAALRAQVLKFSPLTLQVRSVNCNAQRHSPRFAAVPG
jgi:hypothetical protein